MFTGMVLLDPDECPSVHVVLMDFNFVLENPNWYSPLACNNIGLNDPLALFESPSFENSPLESDNLGLNDPHVSQNVAPFDSFTSENLAPTCPPEPESLWLNAATHILDSKNGT